MLTGFLGYSQIKNAGFETRKLHILIRCPVGPLKKNLDFM